MSTAGFSEGQLRQFVLGVLRSSPVSVLVRQLQPQTGTGDPNGAVTGGPGALYVNQADGRLWVHESAAVSDTGWVVK